MEKGGDSSVPTLAYIQPVGSGIANFAEFSHVITTFTGDNPEVSINEFLDRMDEIAGCAGWNDSQTLSILKLKISGSAIKWLRSQPQLKNCCDLEKFKGALRDRFSLNVGITNALTRFTTAVQGTRESTREFLSRLLGLSYECFPDNETTRVKLLMNQVFSGLQHRIRRFIMAQRPATFEEVWHLAIREEECCALEKCDLMVNTCYSGDTTNTSELVEIKELLMSSIEGQNQRMTDLKLELRKLEGRVNQLAGNNDGLNRSNTITCFKCGQVGHTQRYCKVAYNTGRGSQSGTNRGILRCFKCDQEGHTQRFCRNMTELVGDQQPSTSVENLN